ncbi:MAG: DUF3501 family protein [Arenimonas sp.]
MSATITPMNKLSREDLMPLERYSSERKAFREQAIAYKKNRHVALSPNISLLFENRLTVQYQIQEMLRIERIFEADAIQEELDTYNPLIPDGSNLKATLLFEYPDPIMRAERLGQLAGIEHRVYAEVEGFEKTFAFADEDLDRSTEKKTSAVHFMRFEFNDSAIAALRNGASLTFGFEDPRLPLQTTTNTRTLDALLADFH